VLWLETCGSLFFNLSFWDRVGHALIDGRAVGLLERSVCKPLQFRSLEDDFSVFNVVYGENTMLAYTTLKLQEDGV
jgi:hypothetical protein